MWCEYESSQYVEYKRMMYRCVCIDRNQCLEEEDEEEEGEEQKNVKKAGKKKWMLPHTPIMWS